VGFVIVRSWRLWIRYGKAFACGGRSSELGLPKGALGSFVLLPVAFGAPLRKEVVGMGQEEARNGVAYLPPGEGKSVWIANNEFVTLKTTGKDTGGLFALVEVVGLPGSGPPPHIHHSVDEVYCLLEGQLEVLDGERGFAANAGSVFHVPKGTLHAWRNATTKPARMFLFIIPAGFEGFFEEAGVPGTDLSSPPPPPTPEDFERMAAIGRKYETEYPPLPAW
jgi:quercetin dioxygenase-like cupin family protein